MRGLRLTISAVFTSALVFGANAALAADWRLVEVTGTVRVAAPGRQPVQAHVNELAPTGSSITTAAGGRAVLFNGAQKVTVAANSRMTVAPEPAPGQVRIVQDLGSILFQVDKQPAKHFRVDTPLLAAIVKGTTFTVNVGPLSDTVHVAEGLVEVRPSGGGQGVDVPAGATGAVSRDAPQSVTKTTPVAEATTPEPAKVEPLNYADVSGGLVEAAPRAGRAGRQGAHGRCAGRSALRRKPGRRGRAVRARAGGPDRAAAGAARLGRAGQSAAAACAAGPAGNHARTAGSDSGAAGSDSGAAGSHADPALAAGAAFAPDGRRQW